MSLYDYTFLDNSTPFENGVVLAAASFMVGSLSLYKDCVKKIVPGDGSLKRLKNLKE